MGTPQYMAPEQVRGRGFGVPVDVWALGVLLYVAAAGRHPFDADSVLDIYDQITRREPDPAARAAGRHLRQGDGEGAAPPLPARRRFRRRSGSLPRAGRRSRSRSSGRGCGGACRWRRARWRRWRWAEASTCSTGRPCRPRAGLGLIAGGGAPGQVPGSARTPPPPPSSASPTTASTWSPAASPARPGPTTGATTGATRCSDYEKAEEDARRAIAARSRNPSQAWLQLSRVKTQRGRLQVQIRARPAGGVRRRRGRPGPGQPAPLRDPALAGKPALSPGRVPASAWATGRGPTRTSSRRRRTSARRPIPTPTCAGAGRAPPWASSIWPSRTSPSRSRPSRGTPGPGPGGARPGCRQATSTPPTATCRESIRIDPTRADSWEQRGHVRFARGALRRRGGRLQAGHRPQPGPRAPARRAPARGRAGQAPCRP